MPELCRNFQRGRCEYGERCRYLHTQQQQRNSNVNNNNSRFGAQSNSNQQQNSNPFGFGSRAAGLQQPQQQQKTNPFGFGTQTTSHSQFQSNQSKPFENKWSRSSSKPQNGTSRQSDNNSQPVSHKCTDPEVCKRQIAEDFEHEKPLWILTCYGHCKGAPCDIGGDISYEELRTAAYEDAKKGMSFQSIVEKERNILKSKLVEFEKLLSEPYKMPLNSSLDIQNHQSNGANANAFSLTAQNNGPSSVSGFVPNGANANAFSLTTQNNGPVSVSSFSQLGSSMNLGFESPSAPPTNTPAQPSPFGSGGMQPSPFGSGGMQPSPFGSGGMQPSSFGGGSIQPTSIGGGGIQPSSFGSAGNFLTSNTANLFGSGSGPQSNPFSTLVGSTAFPGSTSQFQFQQSPTTFNNTSSTTTLQTSSDVQSSKSQVENVPVDASIWLKEKWRPGEIPEEAPPDNFVR